MAQHVERWLTEVVRDSVRRRTVQGYCDIARPHILPTLGGMKLAQLQPGHIQQLYVP